MRDNVTPRASTGSRLRRRLGLAGWLAVASSLLSLAGAGVLIGRSTYDAHYQPMSIQGSFVERLVRLDALGVDRYVAGCGTHKSSIYGAFMRNDGDEAVTLTAEAVPDQFNIGATADAPPTYGTTSGATPFPPTPPHQVFRQARVTPGEGIYIQMSLFGRCNLQNGSLILVAALPLAVSYHGHHHRLDLLQGRAIELVGPRVFAVVEGHLDAAITNGA